MRHAEVPTENEAMNCGERDDIFAIKIVRVHVDDESVVADVDVLAQQGLRPGNTLDAEDVHEASVRGASDKA